MWKRNILIEQINKKELEKLDVIDLRQLRTRFINIYDKYFIKYNLQKAAGMARVEFMAKYNLLRKELNDRGIESSPHQPIDQELGRTLFKSVMYGLDISMLNDMLVIPDYVSISGDFISSPTKAGKIKVVIKNKEENRSEKFEGVIGQLIKNQTRKEPVFVYEPHGPDRSYIPVFDLILKAHDEIEKVNVAKEEDIRKLSAPQWVEYNTETEKIRENQKLPIASKPHEFKAAKFTHPNGHPRCLICGDDEPVGKVCNMTGTWYEKHEYDDEEAWKEERKALRASGKLKKSFTIKKPEETDDTIRIPVGDDCEVTATITIDESQGIKALYCGKVKKIRTYLFDKKKKSWTMASARAWIKEHKAKTEKALGEGQGVGGERQGIGGAGLCVCPECGYEQKHERGVACADIECPECGTPMKGKVGKDTIFKIMKVDKKEQIIGGIVYESDEIDTQGDYTDAKEIEKAMYLFMEKYATDTKRARINHKGKRYHFPILECFQPEEDTIKGDKPLKKGSWWLMMKVTNKDIWNKIESGELEAFSMGGTAKG